LLNCGGTSPVGAQKLHAAGLKNEFKRWRIKLKLGGEGRRERETQTERERGVERSTKMWAVRVPCACAKGNKSAAACSFLDVYA